MSKITVQSTIKSSIDKVWDAFTKPEHITKWNFASADWHSPKASNELKVKGRFNYLMAAKDGSFEFDFCGTFTSVEQHKQLNYKLDDDRIVEISFKENENSIEIVETFDAETVNSLELQQQGWQAILDNFKKYVESHN